MSYVAQISGLIAVSSTISFSVEARHASWSLTRRVFLFRILMGVRGPNHREDSSAVVNQHISIAGI